MSDITKAVLFACKWHADQRYGDNPYINHLAEVAEIVSLVHDEETIIIAYLHDSLEDSEALEEDLRLEFGDTITEGVIALTRRKDESYFDYIKRIKLQPRNIRVVKIADLCTNLCHCQITPEKYKSLIKRYTKALDILLA